MKFNFITKFAIFIVTTFLVQSPLSPHLHKLNYGQGFLFQKFNIVSDSIDSINKIKQKENPYKVLREYKISDNNDMIIVKTKIHYSDYRKKPKVYQNFLNVDTSHVNAKSIFFTYNSKKDKNHIIQTNKGSKENTKIALNNNNIKLTKST